MCEGGISLGEQTKWDDMSNELLLAEYKSTGDRELKKVLVMRYAYLVKNVALRFRGVYLDFAQVDDIINEGVILLMTALDKYDPDQNAKFETYVAKRLRGMIVDLARKQDWIPRSIRKQMREMNDAHNILCADLGRAPTDKEMAEKLGLTEEDYQKKLAKTALSNVLSLDMILDDRDSDMPAKRLPQADEDTRPEAHLEKKELSETLTRSIDGLRENEKTVLSLYYQRSLQMKEIAQVLGVSEARVSQIHSNAIRKLRIQMTDYMKGT